MKKKILALCLVVVLAVTAVTGVTLAYFTDTDTASNVMTMGNLDIEIEELDKNGDPFDANNVTVMPSNNAGYISDGYDLNDVNNWVDKLVNVKNLDASTDAWLRSIILFEVPNTATVYEETDLLSETGYDWFFNKLWIYFDVNDPTVSEDCLKVKELVTIDGTQYAVAVCLPQDTDGYKPGETYEALAGFALDKSVTSAEMNAMGPTYDVLVLGQGLQKDAATSYAGVPAAFDAAFGELNVTNIAKWFAGDDFAE